MNDDTAASATDDRDRQGDGQAVVPAAPPDGSTIVCLNYCMTDPETGYCLTCGRPPAPVESFSPRFFGRLSLADMTVIETPNTVADAGGDSP